MPHGGRSVVGRLALAEAEQAGLGAVDHRGIADDVDRVAPGLDVVGHREQHAAQHDDAAVRGGQGLLGVQGDRPLRALRLRVTGEPLALLVGQLVVLLAVLRDADHEADHALGIVRADREEEPVAGVVGGHDPQQLVRPLVGGDLHEVGQPENVGKVLLHREAVLADLAVLALDLESLGVLQPVVGALVRHTVSDQGRVEEVLGVAAGLAGAQHLVTAVRGVQPGDVRRVGGVLVDVEPAEVGRHAEDRGVGDRPAGEVLLVLRGVLQHVVAREFGLELGRAHVDEDQAVALLDGVPRLTGGVAPAPQGGLACLLDAAALDVEFPAVVAAADAVVLDAAVEEAGTAVGAALDHDTGVALSVPEDDQVLTEYAGLLRQGAA